MASQIKNMLIGLFVIIACCLIVGIILFLEPSVGDGKQTLIVRFSNINGLNVGTRVLFAGKPVGEVVEIQQIPNAREQPTDDLGQVYFYQLIMHLDSSVRIFNTDELTVQTSGLLGEKSIAVIPRAAPKGVKPRVITIKEPLYAESVDPLESAFNELGELSEKVEDTLDKVISWIDQNGTELGDSIRSFDGAMAQVNLAISRINELDVMGSLNRTLTSLHSTTSKIDQSLLQLQNENTFEHLGEMVSSLKDTTQQISKGKGTLGKLITDDNFYLNVNAILSKMDTLMNDVNHYGVLFNLNKQWQRERLKRVSEMNALNTPSNFKKYFEGEVDTINTSMARLSMLIDKASSEPDAQKIFHAAPFQQDFRTLMRHVEELSNNLKLYNQQLADQQWHGGN